MKIFNYKFVSARHPQTCKPIKDSAASNGVSNLQRCRAAGYLTLAAVLLAGIKLALRNKAAQKWSEIMKNLSIPTGYEPALNLHDTQIAIKTVKDFFQNLLAERLNLLRVSAPLFVTPESGLNDNLNGVERPVSFGIKDQGEAQAEIVHSLAKWKRYALQKYGFSVWLCRNMVSPMAKGFIPI